MEKHNNPSQDLMALDYESIPGIKHTDQGVVNLIRSRLVRLLISDIDHQPEPAMQEIRLPIVCLLNGTGGSGKDTFVDMCRDAGLHDLIHESTINPVKAAAQILIENDRRDCVMDAVIDKTEEYRLFLHNIKMAWSTFSNGSTHYVYNLVKDTIIKVAANQMKNPVIIFVDVREPDELERLKQTLTKSGIVVITTIVRGLVKPADHENEADANVENYRYEYTVVNIPGDLDNLRSYAEFFVSRITAFFYSDDYTARYLGPAAVFDNEKLI